MKGRPLSETLKKLIEGDVDVAESSIGSYEKEKKDLNRERGELLNDGLRDYFKARKGFAKKIYWLVATWFVFIATVIILTGASVLKFSDTILLTLITTTTVNVCAFLIIVAKYLFPKTDNDLLKNELLKQ